MNGLLYIVRRGQTLFLCIFRVWLFCNPVLCHRPSHPVPGVLDDGLMHAVLNGGANGAVGCMNRAGKRYVGY